MGVFAIRIVPDEVVWAGLTLSYYVQRNTRNAPFGLISHRVGVSHYGLTGIKAQ
jgi:hypothetical protein